MTGQLPRRLFQWRGFRQALQGLHEYLHSHNAVFLCGASGSGKSTLVDELIADFHQQGVPHLRFTEPMQRSVSLYKAMAEALDLPLPRKKDQLLKRLHHLKQADKFCLIVIDQAAIDCSHEVTRALFRLCDTNTRVSGSIKLVVVRNDYLVLPTPATPNTAFHQWISDEVKLPPIGSDEIENYLGFLCQQRHRERHLLQQGTDLAIYRQSAGNISILTELLLPLLEEEEMITENNLFPVIEEQPIGLQLLWIPLFLALMGGVITAFYLMTDSPVETETAVQQQSRS
ncbi:AAA family ATPase [Pontibacter sp. JAM-7]|uniref:AAA family ATPase n=1 Tax=Pontibacter sp. JAM-7 TaxID=3366581 RepID=UPI003AF6E414